MLEIPNDVQKLHGVWAYGNPCSFQLSRKMEIAEGEKNQSVIKYAMREAELMKLQAEVIYLSSIYSSTCPEYC